MRVASWLIPVSTLARVVLTVASATLAAQTDVSTTAAGQPLVLQRVSTMPLAFTENKGQWDGRVLFQVRTQGMTIWFTRDGVYYHSIRCLDAGGGHFEEESGIPDPKSPLLRGTPSVDSIEQQVIRSSFEEANPDPSVVGEGLMDYRCNYFIGNDPSEWHTDVPNYNRIVYHDLYPGIDLAFYGKSGALEYDFIVHPGADPSAIVLRYDGVQSTGVDLDGNLVLVTPWGEMTHRIPQLYQLLPDGERVHTSGGFCTTDDGMVRFDIPGRNDPALALVIDPLLSYSTYLGGGSDEEGHGIAVDGNGNAYVTGQTLSTDFPTTPGCQTDQSGWDVYVTKLNAAGNDLVYSTYLGGGDIDYGRDVAVDGSGRAYVTGETYSTDFPTANPYQTDRGASDVFVTKLSSTGDSLVYSTYLGGGNKDGALGIALDGSDNAYVTGVTSSNDFPTVNRIQAYQGGSPNGWDAFVTKLSSTGDSLMYSTYLGGSADDVDDGIAVDGSGNAYVIGYTWSNDFPTVGRYQTHQGIDDAFVTKLNSNGDSLVYSTYLGGSSSDQGFGIAVDGNGNAYVTGYTWSTDFPTVGPYQTHKGPIDAFVTKLNVAGNDLVYSAFLGGGSNDFGRGIAVDGSGNASVTGYTGSTDFPTVGAYQTYQVGYDAFATKLNSAGNALVYSTYLGGNGDDRGFGIALDGTGHAYVNGPTSSTDFPTRNSYAASIDGIQDAFVLKLQPPLHVISLANSGSGSLREAITSANANPGPDTIDFAVAGTIQLTTTLPPLSDVSGGTVILGFTAPGASSPTTPTVILDGASSAPSPGLLINSSNNRIVGLVFRNFKDSAGVEVIYASSVSNTVTDCQFYGTTRLGIDLGGDGITLNDLGDADIGPNTLLNYPVFDSILEAGPDTFTVYGAATPSSRVELYLASETGNPIYQPGSSTHGPAYLLLGATVASAGGSFSFPSIVRPEWSMVTATATDPAGNTSELALNRPLTPDPLRITGYSEQVSPLRGAVLSPLSSPALQVIVYSPPFMGHIDSIGPNFNTFGSHASYDSLTDYNSGGLPDARVKIASPDTGEYQIKYVLIGDPGTRQAGIGIDGHSEIKTKIVFAVANQVDSTTYHLATPPRGELTSDGVFDVSDVLAEIGIVFSNKSMPDPPWLADVNCDGAPDVLDVLYLINFVFVNGPAPCR